VYFARDLFVDGLGVDGDALGIAIAVCAFVVALAGLALWRKATWRGAWTATILLVPYGAWIAIGQNLRQQPRHALPLVVALAVGLAVAASRAGADARHWRVASIVLALLVATRTAFDASARRAILPAGAQLAAFASELPDARGIAVFAGPSARFLESTDFAKRAASVPSLDDARLALTRLDDYPRRVLVTDELDGVASTGLPLLTTLCRPARLDRRMPCLRVYDWKP
jgi:hypothetical protein